MLACAPVSASPSRSRADLAPGGVALGEALGGIAERGRRRRRRRWPRSTASRPAAGRARAAPPRSSRRAPRRARRGRPRVFFGIAVPVGFRVAGRGPGQRAASDVIAEARCSVDGSMRPARRSRPPRAAQVRRQLVGSLAQLPRQLAQLLGEPGARILGIRPRSLEIVGRSRRAGPPGGRQPRGSSLLLRDDRVLRVREDDDRHEEDGRHDRHERRIAREARPNRRRRRAAAAPTASRRWRRTKRSVSAASSTARASDASRSRSSAGGVAEPGTRRRARGRDDTRSPRPPSTSTARAVSPERRPCADHRPRAARAARRPGSPPRRPARPRAARTGRPSTGRLRRRRSPRAPATSRRTMRRSQRRRRWARARPDASSDGSSGPVRTRSRIGRDDRRLGRPRRRGRIASTGRDRPTIMRAAPRWPGAAPRCASGGSATRPGPTAA